MRSSLTIYRPEAEAAIGKSLRVAPFAAASLASFSAFAAASLSSFSAFSAAALASFSAFSAA